MAEVNLPPKINKWVVALTVILPTFIEVMDTSVVNVSLPHIQGGLSAGLDESTWVLTSYLVSNAVIIPLTSWLANLFGRKRYLIFSIILFTLSSVACGSAPNLPVLILARILQGLGGGGLQPLSQAILLETFPVREHGLAMAVFGMGVVLAPTLGPVLGGWITDQWSWRWVFYINIPIGILSVILTVLFIYDPEYIQKIKQRIDYWGLFLVVVGLGCLQVVLDKGQREDWFDSRFIVVLSIIATLSLLAFVWVELKSKDPVVNLRIFRDRTYATGNFIMFSGFMFFFGSIVLLPLFLQNLMNYTALWAGLVLGPGGLATLLVMMVAGILMKKGVPAKYLLALGLLLVAWALHVMGKFNLQAGFWNLTWPRVVQASGLGLFFVPLAAATYVNIPKQEMGNASAVFNLLRNLGGSFGTAFATTCLARREQFHQNMLIEQVTPFRETVQIYLSKLQAAFDPTHAPYDLLGSKGVALILAQVRQQAALLAFNDCFLLFGLLSLLIVPLTLLLKQVSKKDVNLAVH